MKEQVLAGILQALQQGLQKAIPQGIVKPPVDRKKFADEQVTILRDNAMTAMLMERLDITDDDIRVVALKALELEKVETV